MKILINKQRLNEFMENWPCSGFHQVSTIEAEFDESGDIVDISILGCNGETLDPYESDIDGHVVSCLLDDCKKEANYAYLVKCQEAQVASMWQAGGAE